MDNYLVVGGAGIVGRFIAGLLADAGHAPLIIDREPAGRAFDQRVMDALDLPEQAPELLEATTALVLALPEEVALQVLERCGGRCRRCACWSIPVRCSNRSRNVPQGCCRVCRRWGSTRCSRRPWIAAAARWCCANANPARPGRASPPCSPRRACACGIWARGT
ncbi:hypothetical protein CSV86_002350 [Pseudomonas putida CSV86]|uniref:Uncharacterized protein n=1 Tax=Pseudomonas bharatica CSV86 TaxID=1005395 RepID=A0A7K4E979_9PSED|nr:hypothetical protein [Pseudomonas bharatica]NNJ14183.1 hypothetical protein [Pseudomonas bharatica CSV86]